ncbi:hypothetical protein NDU88_004347 [Pleurodeles waltl]|uniref:Uncharacterized protein n=1 Tax=Pleurodeles waltl TaxID=8319 RepID=A0AAV7PFH6_PLEWA|nr:hypothetical protein NDU88_004347 [Pleurodeles waltl]
MLPSWEPTVPQAPCCTEVGEVKKFVSSSKNPCLTILIAIKRSSRLESQSKSALDHQSSTEERPLVDLTRHCNVNPRAVTAKDSNTNSYAGTRLQ